jgi:hypothetical protein
MSRWQKTCNAFNLAVFMLLTQIARSALGHKRHAALPPKADMCGAT